MSIFEQIESNVRSYCHSFPALFTKARGYRMWDDQGQEYIDFFTGASSLNYGHNNPRLKRKLLDYITEDGVAHSLDMSTAAKGHFLQRFNDVILRPRGLNYKVMFPGPTGTNAVESALKLARKVTGRQTIISFTNGFHGMTLGALAITGNSFKRQGAGVPLHHAIHMPYDGFLSETADSLDYLERFLAGNGSGIDLPAAIILETVQGEGGINAASFEWLKAIEQLCRRWEILLIIDDIQAGCGRTGPFFSFEPAGIQPDMVTLSKSISGYGLPMALTLFRPELDIWEPGEHNGTFRGNNLAFVTAAESLSYWETDDLSRQTENNSKKVWAFLDQLVNDYPELQGEVRGRGMMLGVACGPDGLAGQVCQAAFERGLLIETSGPNGEVFKLLPPLVIESEGLDQGLQILADSVAHAVSETRLLEKELV